MFTENEIDYYMAEFQKIGVTEESVMKDILNYLYSWATVAYEVLN